MTIVGCDFHPGWQQVAVFDSDTGEIREPKLNNADGEAERFYRQLGPPALIGFEECGNTQWFLALLSTLNQQIRQLDEAVERAAEENQRAQLLMTQPGVGPITALAYVVTMGDVSRFKRGKQVGSYLGLIPSEHSSSNRRRLGAISKQGNPFMRMLLVESAQAANRLDEGFRKQYRHRCQRMAKGTAKVAAARRLAVRLFWMLGTSTSGDRSHREQSEVSRGQ